ncbi:hypothetical protein BU17DRAFT_13809, partial [Hysterangium stoloniferum]
LLGNLFDVPRSCEYEGYTKWKETYGDIAHIKVFGKHIIIINLVKVVKELLEQCSAIYSNRPYIPMVHDSDLMDLNWTFIMQRYTSTWKSDCHLFVQHFNSPMVKTSYSLRQMSSTHTLLQSLLHSPTELDVSIRHTIGNMLLGMVYGFDVQPGN